MEIYLLHSDYIISHNTFLGGKFIGWLMIFWLEATKCKLTHRIKARLESEKQDEASFRVRWPQAWRTPRPSSWRPLVDHRLDSPSVSMQKPHTGSRGGETRHSNRLSEKWFTKAEPLTAFDSFFMSDIHFETLVSDTHPNPKSVSSRRFSATLCRK